MFKGLKLGKNIPDFYELVTAPVMKVGYASCPGHGIFEYIWLNKYQTLMKVNLRTISFLIKFDS